VLTPLMGLIAVNSMAYAMLVPLGCYGIISLYAFCWSVPKAKPGIAQ
jgi:hypothetical protein